MKKPQSTWRPPGSARISGPRKLVSRILLVFSLIGLLQPQFLAALPPGQSSGHHKIRVDNPSLVPNIQAAGGQLIEDYGAFQLFQVPALPQHPKALPGIEVRDDYNLVHLNAGTLDTTQPEVKSLRKRLDAFTGKRLHLVQFSGPIKNDWLGELQATGAKLVSYVPQNTYMVYGDSVALTRLQSLAASSGNIQWDAPYQDDYKLHPLVRSFEASSKPQAAQEFAVQLVLDSGANTDTLQLLDRLKLAPFRQKHAVLNYLNVVVRLPALALKLLAARTDLVSIQPFVVPEKMCERLDQIIAGNLSSNVPSGPGYLAWLGSKGFTSAQFTNSGFLVDVTDSGVDQGTTSPNHFALHAGGILTNASRVFYARLEGTPNTGSTLQGCDGHGTLDAHILAGYDNLTGFPHVDASGYHYGLGVCPFVGIGSSVIFDPDDYTYPNFINLQSEAYESGARISNNSWGAKVSGRYDILAQEFDSLVRDAQPTGSTFPTAGNQEMVIVCSAGNNSAPQTILSPASAKNVISVGAAESVQAFGGADNGGIDDSGANNANEVISFSSQGPCSDGRHKPEIMAPGTHVSGGVIQAPSPSSTGTADPCFTTRLTNSIPGYAIDGGPTSSSFWPFFPDAQQFFSASSGTSQSAAAVSGGCALVRQYFINSFSHPPSAAMTKAWLMNSARYMTGAGADDTLWSDSQGMGEMDLSNAFDSLPRIIRDQVPADLFTNSGQMRTFTGEVSNTNQPFLATLAWTDAPGSTTGNAYNNDLDLLVFVNGTEYKGNVFNGPWSTNGGAADPANNVESVFLPPGTSGNVLVRVVAANINSDGVPGNGYPLDQDFALVIKNAVSVPLPFIEAAGSSLVTETCFPTNGVIDPGEMVTVSFALKNTGTGPTTNLVATLLPAGGVSEPSGPQNYGALPAGGSAVSMPFTFQANGNCGGTITATLQLSDGSLNLWTVSYTFTLGRFSNPLVENFDEVSVPALPPGWQTSVSNAGIAWVTSSNISDTASNSAFDAEASSSGLGELVSPPIAISSPTAQLTFQNAFSTDADQVDSSKGYAGGVLEIQIGDAPFTDIISAGGTFVAGGYNRTIDANGDNPFAGWPAWSGDSGGFAPTVVTLPAAAAGQIIRLKWALGSDSTNSTGNGGWYIDTVGINEGYLCCAMPPVITQQPTNQTVLLGSSASFQAAASGTPPMNYQWLFDGVVFDSQTNTFLQLTNVQPAQMGSYSLVVTNVAGSVTSQVALLRVLVPPSISDIVLSSSNVTLSFPTVSGLNYELEYKDSLTAPQWTPLPPPLTGDGTVLSLIDTNSPATNRFYRLRSY